MIRSKHPCWMGAVGVCALISLSSCLPTASDNEQVLSAGPPDIPGLDAPLPSGTSASIHTETEPNDTYQSAETLTLAGPTIDVIGAVAPGVTEVDRDLFDVGSAKVGDRITGLLTAPTGADIILGLLDDQGRLLSYMDPTSPTSGPAWIDAPIFEDTSRLYLVATTQYGLTEAVDYTAQLQIQRSADLPAYRPQIVVLHFSGGDDIRIGNRPPVDVPPFDAASIHASFTGRTEEMINAILAIVREDFSGLNISIYRDTDPTLPPGEKTVIYFGTYDDRLLGLADSIDPYNADATQSAILYTDTFSLFTTLSTDLYDIAQALGNVASHETGHLLGLRHTKDASSIMDITASARQMMLDQFFTTSPLHASVMSIGHQDAPALLSWTLGGQLPVQTKSRAVQRQQATAVRGLAGDFHIPHWRLGTCHCEWCADHQASEAEDEHP